MLTARICKPPQYECIIGLDLAPPSATFRCNCTLEYRLRRLVQLQVSQWRSGACRRLLRSREHGRNISLPRLAGWWVTIDHALRMQLQPGLFEEGADGWQVSNRRFSPGVRASLELFDKAGMSALRAKSGGSRPICSIFRSASATALSGDAARRPNAAARSLVVHDHGPS
jgi:hypothetical protein